MIPEKKDTTHPGWDVHAHTARYRPIAKLWCEQWGLICAEEEQVFVTLLKTIQTTFPDDRRVHETLRKFAQRWNTSTGGWSDNDLHGMNIAKVLRLTWNEVVATQDTSILEGFREQLHDIGTTCIQGDSHRLFGYLVALVRDRQAIT